jgi:hypothetical protein
VETGAMVGPLRHRQTKGAETDMPGLPPPRHIPTLPITDDLEASVPPPPKSGPSQDALAAISRFTRCTVPVPTPSALAVLRIPAPVTSSVRIRSTTSAVTGRRPSRFPCARARERPRLTLARMLVAPLRTADPEILIDLGDRKGFAWIAPTHTHARG